MLTDIERLNKKLNTEYSTELYVLLNIQQNQMNRPIQPKHISFCSCFVVVLVDGLLDTIDAVLLDN